MEGQMTIFDFIKKDSIHHDCEGCSLMRYGIECMENRGFLWNRYRGDYYFVDGKLARIPLEERKCKKENNGLR